MVFPAARRPGLPARLLLVVTLTLPGAAFADGEARLRAFLADVQSLDGAFSQRVTDSRQQVVEEATGTVAMERPGRFRWDYTAPFERVIVSDGDRLWLYEADLAQVTIRKLSAGIGDTPAALITGKVSVLDRFRVEKSWTAEGLELVRLVPRSADADFAGVTLGFAGPVLRRLLLDDRLGQQTRVELRDVRQNPRLPAGTFRFDPPAGADVIDDGEL
ncbi:MAG: outer membrane lipoprotein chaperone LolA [Gammaproteobacteria bacterium]|nr:outer membrane lipoprotein chaperone LolA [Gammaproteobacteria bacterium]